MAMTNLTPINVSRGQEPKASPAVRPGAVILGLLLLGIAGVAGREVWRLVYSPGADSWTQPVIDLMSINNLQPWMPYAGAVAVILGLWCVVLALLPRRRTHVRFLAGEHAPSAWIRSVDIARHASAIAHSIPGVTAARTTCTKHTVRTVVNGDAEDPALATRVSAAISAQLQHLPVSLQPQVTVEQIAEVDNNV